MPPGGHRCRRDPTRLDVPRVDGWPDARRPDPGRPATTRRQPLAARSRLRANRLPKHHWLGILDA